MSDAQQRAAEVFEQQGLGPNMTGKIVAALAREGLLVDDDTARLVNLGRAVEGLKRRGGPYSSYLGRVSRGWDDCIDAIYEEADSC